VLLLVPLHTETKTHNRWRAVLIVLLKEHGKILSAVVGGLEIVSHLRYSQMSCVHSFACSLFVSTVPAYDLALVTHCLICLLGYAIYLVRVDVRDHVLQYRILACFAKNLIHSCLLLVHNSLGGGVDFGGARY